MNITTLEEAMGGSVPVEVTRVMRALAKLDAAIEAVEASGIEVDVDQKWRWTDGGNKRHHNGFKVELEGRFRVANIHIPESPRPMAVEKTA